MGKNNREGKNSKPFNPIRNVEKLQELKPKLRKLESNNNGTEPDSHQHVSSEKKEQMFSIKDREIILYIRELFLNNGEKVDYFKETNAIIFPIKKDLNVHPLLISCRCSVLHIFSMKNISASNSSNEVLKYIMCINSKIPMGGFYYNTKKDSFMYQMTAPLYEKPGKEFIWSLLAYSVDILEEYVPEILLSTNEAHHQKRENINPTLH
jgi:hypothetical protein